MCGIPNDCLWLKPQLGCKVQGLWVARWRQDANGLTSELVERIVEYSEHGVPCRPAFVVNGDRGFNVNAVPSLKHNTCYQFSIRDNAQRCGVNTWRELRNALGHPLGHFIIEAKQDISDKLLQTKPANKLSKDTLRPVTTNLA